MRIVIVDDHPVVRRGLELTLKNEKDFEVVGSASSCPEGVETIKEKDPDIAIVDMKMPGGGGLELIRKARKLTSCCRFIILTSYASRNEVAQAVQENVEGYILKEALPEELISALRLVFKGRRYYDPEIIDSVISVERKHPLNDLTKRELEILTALAQGNNNKSIAEHLFISENTVKKHIGNLLSKLELKDRTQAALFAVSQGLSEGQETQTKEK